MYEREEKNGGMDSGIMRARLEYEDALWAAVSVQRDVERKKGASTGEKGGDDAKRSCEIPRSL